MTLADGGVLRRSAVLDGFGQCIVSTYRAFESKAVTLQSATAAYAADRSDVRRDVARAAWIDAMETWERAEVTLVGPAAPSGLPGGKGYRDEIYAWPLLNRCQIDSNTDARAYADPTFERSLVNVRSLYGLEYLLFHDGAENGCPPTASINASGSWNALGGAEVAARRADYARVVAADVVTRTHVLIDAWDPAKGNFLAKLRDAGKTEPYSTQQVAFNGVSDAIFYIEFETKDTKVATPAGLSNCSTSTCPDALESKWAGRSKAHVRNNLLGVRDLFDGCGAADQGTALGFDDLLRAMEHGRLADDIERAISDALAALDAIEEADLAPALAADLGSVRAFHTALKRLTDILKTELVSILDLELPKKIEGDND